MNLRKFLFLSWTVISLSQASEIDLVIKPEKPLVTKKHVADLVNELKKLNEEKKPIAGSLDLLNDYALSDDEEVSENAQIALGKLMLDPTLDPMLPIITKLPISRQKPPVEKINFNALFFEEFVEKYLFAKKDPPKTDLNDVVNFFKKHEGNRLRQLILSGISLMSKEDIKDEIQHPYVPCLYNTFKDTIKPLNVLIEALQSYQSLSTRELESTRGLVRLLKEREELKNDMLKKISDFEEFYQQRLLNLSISNLDQISDIDERFCYDLMYYPPNLLKLTSKRKEIFSFLKLNQHKLKGESDFQRMIASLLYASALEESKEVWDLCPVEKSEKENDYLKALYHHTLYALMKDKEEPIFGSYNWGGVMMVLDQQRCSCKSTLHRNQMRAFWGMQPVVEFYLNVDVKSFEENKEYRLDGVNRSHRVLGHFYDQYFGWFENNKKIIGDLKGFDKSEMNKKRIDQLVKLLPLDSSSNVLGVLVNVVWYSTIMEDEKVKVILDYIDQSAKVLDFSNEPSITANIVHNLLGALDCRGNTHISDLSKSAQFFRRLMEYGLSKEDIVKTLDESGTQYAQFLKEALN